MVSDRANVPVEKIFTAARLTDQAIEARHCVMWLMHHGFGYGWSQIKHAMKKDHSTVINGVRRFGYLMTFNEFWRRTAHELLEAIDNEEHLKLIKVPPKQPVVKPLVQVNDGSSGRASISMYDRDGDKGTSRAFLEAQNERFAKALREGLEREAQEKKQAS